MEKSLYAEDYRVLLAHLREARVQAEVTQVQMADRLGTTQSMVSKCERGERRLDAIELRRWVMELGFSFPEFIAEFEASLGSGKKRALTVSKRKRKAE